MNLFKSLLILHGHVTDPSILNEPNDDFGTTYGNKVASGKVFGSVFGRHESTAEPTGLDASPAGCR
jgi:hypothetical protein